ncbi:hypothetical protein ACOSQ3_023253 [Xanthoceras sorbifolium]
MESFDIANLCASLFLSKKDGLIANPVRNHRPTSYHAAQFDGDNKGISQDTNRLPRAKDNTITTVLTPQTDMGLSVVGTGSLSFGMSFLGRWGQSGLLAKRWGDMSSVESPLLEQIVLPSNSTPSINGIVDNNYDPISSGGAGNVQRSWDKVKIVVVEEVNIMVVADIAI